MNPVYMNVRNKFGKKFNDEAKWFEFYGDAKEEILANSPEVLGKGVGITGMWTWIMQLIISIVRVILRFSYLSNQCLSSGTPSVRPPSSSSRLALKLLPLGMP